MCKGAAASLADVKKAKKVAHKRARSELTEEWRNLVAKAGALPKRLAALTPSVQDKDAVRAAKAKAKAAKKGAKSKLAAAFGVKKLSALTKAAKKIAKKGLAKMAVKNLASALEAAAAEATLPSLTCLGGR